MIEQQNPNIDYDKGISQMLEELREPKLEYSAKEALNETSDTIGTPNVEPIEVETPNEAEEPDNIINNLTDLPDLIVDMIDMGVSAIASAYAKSDKEKYKLDKDEKTSYKKAWKSYLKNTPDFKMSPTSVLMITTLIIYAPKIIMMVADKKQAKEATIE